MKMTPAGSRARLALVRVADEREREALARSVPLISGEWRKRAHQGIVLDTRSCDSNGAAVQLEPIDNHVHALQLAVRSFVLAATARRCRSLSSLALRS